MGDSGKSESDEMEIWREVWEKQEAEANLPPGWQRPFPDHTVFSDATQARIIINLLRDHGIPSCVTGVKALGYYGAGRLCSTLEFCVPNEQLSAADAIFSTGPAKEDYTPWGGWDYRHEPRLKGSLYHTFPRYKLNDDENFFDFYLVPSIDWRFDCIPENFEYSAQKRIPYPKLHLFAQALMERQSICDLEDLIDGMDLTEEWGDANLRFDDPDGEYARWVAEKNARIRAAMPQEVRDEPFRGGIRGKLSTAMYELYEGTPEFRERFVHMVLTKEARVGPEFPPGLFVTRFRAKDSPDPRTQIRFNV